MAARGSGIGASIGAGVWQAAPGAGRGQSPTQATMYAGPSSRVAGWQGTPVPHLLALVFAEIIILGALRHGFRHHHGG